MEVKKNPKQDVHQQSFRFFLIGLGISVSLSITAFEWTTEKTIHPDRYGYEPPQESTLQVLPALNAHTTSPLHHEKKITVSPPMLTSTTTPETEDHHQPEIDLDLEDDYSAASDGTFYPLPEEDSTQIITLAEVQPKPVGGYEYFYSHLAKNLKYPLKALRNGIDGKVFIEFVVDRTGKISQLKIIKGIGAGCDEEAMRVLSLLPWEPGKQRGKPVNVRLVMPVIFRVN